ncbi:MAG TPA: phosphodiester glycosidase family protein [Longimicrobium sp.]|nr:phosphodiester glycosidase family protein [Longimicrobium sp.]
MSRFSRLPIFVLPLLALAAFRCTARDADAETTTRQPEMRCRARTIAGARYRVCELPPAALGRLRLLARDAQGRPWRTIERLDAGLHARGERLQFAMNAGIYERPDSATGLLVADGGRTYTRLNVSPGPPNPCRTANFYCPPNGVFFVAGGRAAVLSTADFARRPRTAPAVEMATQSGPLLVRRGALAQAFDPHGRSRTIRNGVCVRADGTVVFAISDDGVTLYELATAFRDALACPDALYLDGTISALYTGADLPPQRHDFSAMFAVTEPIAGRR